MNDRAESESDDCEYEEVYVVLSEEAGQPVEGVYVGVGAEYVGAAVGVDEAAVLELLPHLGVSACMRNVDEHF